MSKLTYGIGFNSKGKHKTKIDGAHALAYITWRSMLRRTYCPKLHAINPAYLGCTVSDEWLDYQNFAEWFENHEYSNRGYHLDKDLLIANNKVYSPDTCCFVPQGLNNLLTSCTAARGALPQGVCLYKPTSKFKADIKISGKKRHLGYFDTELEAYHVYKKAKEAYVKEKALEWQDRIASDVFDALMRWELDPK